MTVAHGGAPRGWLELSANLNPLGVPEPVRDAVAGASYDGYADLDPRGAEAHLAMDAGVREALLTSGASEALRLAACALLAPGDVAIVASPTYGEIARVVGRSGASALELRASAPDFGIDVERVASAALDSGARAVLLCDPNNPTGAQLAPAALASLAARLAGRVALVVDQSFLPFGGPTVPAPALLEAGVVLVRSLTKVLAIPGVRAGYVIAPPDILQRMRAARDPWAVGAHAIAVARVATFALDAEARARIAEWRARLVDGLARRRFVPVSGVANFVLAESPRDVEPLVAALAAERIALRACASFGLPRHVRLAVRPPDEQDRLLGALNRVSDERLSREERARDGVDPAKPGEDEE